MTKSVFISYSHKDETHREDLEEQLSMLKRNNVISVWHDRKITAGDDWRNQINENLNNADIIIFLVSPSFLASDYCYDVEVKTAMSRHQAGNAKIISIVIRPCDWQECEFSKFQAVPKDAKPITLWNDKDSAWLDAVSGLKGYIKEFSPAKKQPIIIEPNNTISPSVQTLHWLDDTEILLTHRKVNKVNLSDIFITPDVKVENKEKIKEIKIVSADSLIKKNDFQMISGEEQQGKTTLLKYFYKELLKKDFLPIYIDASKVKKSNLKLILDELIKIQYINLTSEHYHSFEKRVIILDNIDNIGLNQKYRDVFLEQLNKDSNFIIATCHTSFGFVSREITYFDNYNRVEILGFGNLKREEIVKKWISLGVEENIEESELYSQCDEIKSRLDTVIKKNIVPPKPIYVLMLMQMFEANAQLNLDLTSYGHCYQQLIYQAFDQAKISKSDFDKYLNVLTELAWSIFIREENLNDHEIDAFFIDYCKRYLPVNGREVISKLEAHSILKKNGLRTGFKYPYIYYFFVGKKIAESYSDSSSVKEEVNQLLNKLHREDYANILIFITHHTKDSWVLNEIKNVLSSLFSDQNRASLTKEQLSFMNTFIKEIPELIIEQREINKEREAHNQRLDEIERAEPEVVPEGEPMDILANINKTFKGMEIAGQIIRNRHATMTRDSLYELANCGASTGLRFLEYFIKITDTAKNEIVKLITLQLAEHPNLTNKQIQSHAELVYLHLTYGVINGVVRKIASSIGSKEATEIYESLEENENSPAFILIKQAIELQFTRSVKISSIETVTEKLRNNPVCLRILKEMVIQHIYMFPVEYKTKQQLSELLDISVQGQRLMDQRKLGKG